MKTLIIAVAAALALSACGTNMPVQKTGQPNEYLLNRDDKTPFGNLPSVKAAVSADAASFCASMNKKVVEKYSIDKERAVFVWPETTLYFECVDPSDSTMTSGSQAKQASESRRAGKAYDDLLKLDELRKKGVISESEFESEKKKLLDGK